MLTTAQVFFKECFEWIRQLFYFAQYFWAILCFLLDYFGDLIEFELEELQIQGRPPGREIRNLFFPILKVLLVALTTAAAAPPNRDPATVHYMDMNPLDGVYSFGYAAAESAREERRHANGTVEGKYSYINPEGKLIQVSYGADANGFKAYGDHLHPADTPEVKEAKETFMATYFRELERIRGNAITEATPLRPSSSNEIGHVPLGPDEDSEVVFASEQDVDSNVLGIYVAPTAQSQTVPLSEAQTPEDTRSPTTIKPLDEQNKGTRYYNLVYGVGGPRYHGYATSPTRPFLIPIPLSAFERVLEVHDVQIPNSSQRNVFYTRRRARA